MQLRLDKDESDTDPDDGKLIRIRLAVVSFFITNIANELKLLDIVPDSLKNILLFVFGIVPFVYMINLVLFPMLSSRFTKSMLIFVELLIFYSTIIG